MSVKTADSVLRRNKKRSRIRKKIFGTATRPRLAIFRSSRNIYAQLIDDIASKTLAGASTLSPSIQDEMEGATSKIHAAKVVGKMIAKQAKSLKIDSVVFDRGGYLYHGRVKAVAEGARENGLKF